IGVLVDERRAQRRGRAATRDGVPLLPPPRHAAASAVGPDAIDRLLFVPSLRLGREGQVPGEEPGLAEVQPHTAIERRPLALYAEGARSAEKVDVLPFAADARLLLRPVADRAAQLPVLVLGDGDAHGHGRWL